MDSQYNNLLNAYNSLEAAYKRLENSWAYRIGKLVVSPAIFVFDRYRLFRDTVTVKKSGLFDSGWYLQTYDDVKKAGMDPVAHYIQFGWKEGRNPSENFCTGEYLSRRPDVAAAGVCPFVYFIKFGSREDMPEKKADAPSDCDSEKLRIFAMDSQYNNLLNAYNSLESAYKRLENSWSYRIGKLVLFPAIFVFDRYRLFRDTVTVKKSGLFDSGWYLQTYDDVKKAGMDPVAHYIQFGWKEGRNPSEDFDTREYLSRRPDVAAAGICPFVHFIRFGSREDIPEKNAYCEPALNEEAEFIFEKLMFFSEAR